MEELKNLTNHSNVLQLSKALQKIASEIEQQKKDQTKKELAIEELNFLKDQCLSNNVQISLLSSQTLYSLVENGVLEPANVLTMYINMLSNANTPMKISVVGDGIINVLLLDLKIATLRLKSNESYVCPFGMKSAQHPIITLMQKKNVDIIDLASKLNGICNHSEECIRLNSIEFLRPVFLHAFCNPNQTPNAESIWMISLKQQRANPASVQTLFHEMFVWCRVTPDRCLSLSMQLIDLIEVFLEMGNIDAALQYQIYLASLALSLIEFGYDPRNAFNTILKTIQQTKSQINDDDEMFDYMLITMSQIIHNIAPFYLRDAINLVKVLIEQKKVGNLILRHMILDSLIIRLAINGKSLQAQTTSDIEKLIKQFRKLNTSTNVINISKANANKSAKNVKYFHPMIAMNFNLVRLSRNLSTDLMNSQTNTLKRLIDFIHANEHFANEMHFFLRSILLSIENLAPLELWTDILKLLLSNAATNHDVSCDTIYFILYLLAKETEGQKQVELLRGLTSFAAVKENIPLILNTYRSLFNSPRAVLKIVSVDLHTRLWLAENRTYQFLHKVLLANDEKLSTINKWEFNIAKAYAIKEICSHKASQHGTDLVAPLSNIMNNSTDNDLARSLALDAVVSLCRSHTVNIVSTWKVLKNVFNSKLQLRSLKSLCEFFGEVPLLKSSSNEYDLLFGEALNRLWEVITSSDNVEVVKSAIHALRNFDFTELTLKHVPATFYKNIKLSKEIQLQIAASHSDPNNAPLTPADVVPYVPGDCWIQFLQNINENVLDEAIKFVTHLIECEMSQYRSGVYMLAEGRPEPKELQNLHVRSPLKAMIKVLIEQSEDKSEFSTALKCLECTSKKYSRPIPPLNWFFLIEYINQGSKFAGCSDKDQFKMRKFALTIAGNHIAHSGSAKTLVENYLQSFDASDKNPEEIQMALELVASICDGISPRILATFLRTTLTLVYELSASSHFENKCQFELALDAIAKVFDKKCLVPENIDIIADEICRFNEILQSDSKIYDKYSTIILKLPSESLDRLTTPTEWNINNFKKAVIVRSKSVSSQKPFSTATNPWMWINLLIDNVSNSNDSIANNERKEIFVGKMFNLLMDCHNDTALCEWIMYFLGMVQSNFNQELNKDSLAHSVFSLDIFIFSIIVATGCATFVDVELSFSNRMQWINKFPEALWLLSKRSGWANHMPRIFEFLYHLKTQQSHLPKEYTSVVCNTLICVKNNEYFLQKSTWNKFITLK